MQSNMSIHIMLVVIRGNKSYDEDFFLLAPAVI